MWDFCCKVEVDSQLPTSTLLLSTVSGMTGLFVTAEPRDCLTARPQVKQKQGFSRHINP